MLAVACVLLYLAIVKKFEPPAAAAHRLRHAADQPARRGDVPMPSSSPTARWTGPAWALLDGGLIDYLYLGVKLGIYPCLIFVGVGAMTDFGP